MEDYNPWYTHWVLLFIVLIHSTCCFYQFTDSFAMTEQKYVIPSLYCRIKQTSNEYDRRDDISLCLNKVKKPETNLYNEIHWSYTFVSDSYISYWGLMWNLITKEMGNTSHCSTGDLIERSRRNNQQWCCTTKSISVDLCWLCSTSRVQFSWWLRANQYWQSPVLQDWESFCYNGYERWSSYFDVFLFSPTYLQLLVLMVRKVMHLYKIR